MKILWKILLPVLVTASIGLFGSTIYTYDRGLATLADTTVSLQKMAIANALVELKAGLDFNLLNAISLAQTGILQPYLSDNLDLRKQYAHDANSRIVNMKNTYYYVDIGILNPEGIMLDHTNKDFIGEDYSSRSFFKQAMQGKESISAPYRYEGMVVYAVASPVYSLANNAIIGVVFNVSKLTDTMSERMHLGDLGYLFVADKEGVVFIHRDSSKVLLSSLLDDDWGREILAEGSGNMEFVEDGRERRVYFDTLPEAQWVAGAVLDLKEQAGPSNKVWREVTALSVVILIILAMIIYLFVSTIIEALLKAVRYAEQISKGVLDQDLNLSSGDMTFVQKIKHWWLSLTLAYKREDIRAEDLDGLAHFKRDDEVGVLYTALQTMVSSMRSMVQKADDASRMKSEFLANMSHEIRTPLNAVIGLAHLFLTSHEGEEKKSHYVEKIETSGKSLLGIINNVLDTSKIEAGMFELESTHLDIDDLGEQIITIYHDVAKAKGLELCFTRDPKLGTSYISDPVRLGQVLNNLVGNAIKFTEKGSVSIFCHGGSVDLDSVPQGHVPVCIEVRDTGIGISKEQEESLFKPFAQADTSITRRFGGTGLGLAISKQIVELMGGSLHVKSGLGEGTTFIIQLFLHPAEDITVKLAQDVQVDVATHLNLKGKRILVVEDNMINQLIMEELLLKTEATVAMADNGQIAVDMVKESDYDLVLMDMQMPVMDGIQATKVIRESVSAEVLPIIAVTANAMKEDKDRGFAVGLNDYLTKPVDPKNLMLTLHHWLCEKGA